MADEKFESLVAALDGWFDKSFDDLPVALRALVQAGRWGRQDASARRQTASYDDYNNDPATEKERMGIAKFIDELHQARVDVAEMTSFVSTGPTEWVRKKKQLAVLTTRLAEMEAELLVKRGDDPEIATSDDTVTPSVCVQAMGSNTTHTLASRRDDIAPLIDEAIRRAGSIDNAAVFSELRKLALDECGCFTGQIENGGLCYTSSNNKPGKIDKEALSKRLKRRSKKAIPAPPVSANRR